MDRDKFPKYVSVTNNCFASIWEHFPVLGIVANGSMTIEVVVVANHHVLTNHHIRADVVIVTHLN
jgi:hypothetical protein